MPLKNRVVKVAEKRDRHDDKTNGSGDTAAMSDHSALIATSTTTMHNSIKIAT
jgi:hypothetical protein